MKRIGLYLFIIGITFIKAYGQEDSGPVNTGAANYLTIPVDARSAAMGGAGVAISRVNNAVFHNGAATLSEAMHKGGVTYTYSPWMRDYESGYSLHSLGGFYKINKRNASSSVTATSKKKTKLINREEGLNVTPVISTAPANKDMPKPTA